TPSLHAGMAQASSIGKINRERVFIKQSRSYRQRNGKPAISKKGRSAFTRPSSFCLATPSGAATTERCRVEIALVRYRLAEVQNRGLFVVQILGVETTG